MATTYLYEGLVTVSGADTLLPAVGTVMPGTTITRPTELTTFLAVPVSGNVTWRISGTPDGTYPEITPTNPLIINGNAIPTQIIQGYSAGSVTVYVAWG